MLNVLRDSLTTICVRASISIYIMFAYPNIDMFILSVVLGWWALSND